MTTTRKIAKRLNKPQLFMLFEWLKTSEERCKNTTMANMASIAAAELGFEINAQQVSDAAKACGITWIRRPAPRATKQSESSSLQIIAAELAQVITRLGDKPSSELLSIAAGPF